MHAGVGTTNVLAVGGALGSALCFALSSVLQQRSASRAPSGEGLHVGLLAYLCKRPMWLCGLGAAVGTIALQALALSAGPIGLVQPLLITGLLFALPFSVLLERRRPSLAEWLWAVTLVVGITVFLLAARPAAGPPSLDAGVLLIDGGAVVLVVAILIAIGYGLAHRHRATLLGFATGALYGLTAALIKVVIGESKGGLAPLALNWAPYALVVVGVSAIALNQAAYQAGPLAGALPPIVLTDSVVAITLAATAFDETLHNTIPALIFQVLGFGLIALAVVQLARLASGRGPQTGGCPEPANPSATHDSVRST